MKVHSAIIAGIFLGLLDKQLRDIPPRLYIKERLPGNYNALTIPPVGIFIKKSEKDNQALIDHERIHWNQFQRKGTAGYYLQYALEYIRHGYDKMPMEIDARQKERPYCRVNYSECVRTGQSVTVHNPDFRL